MTRSVFAELLKHNPLMPAGEHTLAEICDGADWQSRPFLYRSIQPGFRSGRGEERAVAVSRRAEDAWAYYRRRTRAIADYPRWFEAPRPSFSEPPGIVWNERPPVRCCAHMSAMLPHGGHGSVEGDSERHPRSPVPRIQMPLGTSKRPIYGNTRLPN